MIWAVILAAGESKRMGEQKLLLPFGDNTIIGTVVNNAIGSKIDHAMVVLGSDDAMVRNEVADLPVEIVVNTRFQEGMLSSIQCGFRALPGNAQATLVALGDQPAIPSSVFDAIIDSYKQSEKGLVLPVYQGRRGHPLLVDMKYREDVRRLRPDEGLRSLLRQNVDDILEVTVNTPGILKDIDTREDYDKESVC